MYKSIWYCRWCGKVYKPKKPTERDGFDSAACKMAYYRAYKKYVTGKTDLKKGPVGRVTQGKNKK